MAFASGEHSDTRSSGPETGVLGQDGLACLVLQPCRRGKQGLQLYRENQMQPDIFAPSTECPAFPVVRISSLSLYFCSCHVRIRYNQVCYDCYSARKEKSVVTQGRNQQLKARSASFENNTLDDSIGSKHNQKFMNDTDSLMPVYMTYLVISL